jgi:hypothetical protein
MLFLVRTARPISFPITFAALAGSIVEGPSFSPPKLNLEALVGKSPFFFLMETARSSFRFVFKDCS